MKNNPTPQTKTRRNRRWRSQGKGESAERPCWPLVKHKCNVMNIEHEESDSDEEYLSSVTLCITGHDLDPEMVTRILDMSPSKSWKRGEKKVFRDGSVHIYPWGGWKRFQSDDVLHRPLHEQLEYWVQLLAGKENALKKMCAMNCTAVLDCFVTFTNVATLSIPAGLLEKLARIGIDIEMGCFAHEEQSDAANENKT